jgi:hypothetical protein
VDATLKRLGVELKEQPLIRPQGRVGEPPPERAGRLVERRVGSELQVDQGLALAALHLGDDRRQQPLLGAEVVDQHAMTGPQAGSQRTQAEVGDPVLGGVVDGRGK